VNETSWSNDAAARHGCPKLTGMDDRGAVSYQNIGIAWESALGRRQRGAPCGKLECQPYWFSRESDRLHLQVINCFW